MDFWGPRTNQKIQKKLFYRFGGFFPTKNILEFFLTFQ